MHALSMVMAAAWADVVSDALDGVCGALSVTIEDADAGTADETPVFDEPGVASEEGWRRARLTALFADEPAARAAARAVTNVGYGIEATHLTPVDDVDWVRRTQSQFGPTEIVPGFWIVPSWCERPEGAIRVIAIDPGMAFGTGTHATTRLVLRQMAARAATAGEAPWSRVLDYGCGSGILAIAAASLGAGSVDAVDIDLAAIDATLRNVGVNDVADRVSAGPLELARGSYSLVVANILATPLKLLAPVLASHLAPGGELMLSGILERQAAELCDVYAPHLPLAVVDTDDGWVVLRGRMS